nr:factor H binding protein domain-containing protein [uncultured Cardiobacterium sp.]
MQKTTLNLAAIISAALLTACGGSSDGAAANALVPAPTEPNAAETAAFHASKQRREKTNVVGVGWQPYSLSANGHTLIRVSGDRSNAVEEIDFRSLPAGFAAYNGTYTNRDRSFPVKVRSYQGFRSGVVAVYENNQFVNISPYGTPTPPAALPTAGKATYNGTAFDHSDRGSFTYHVDFAAKTGQGHIDGLNKYKYGDITLAAGKIIQEKSSVGIVGKASAATGGSFDYDLTFSGNRAEEIAGFAANGDTGEGIALHGTRGAITE